MAEVISQADIEASASRIGIDLSSSNLDSIQLPPGEDFGIQRFQEVELVREKKNGYKLDKSHNFVVNLFDDFEKYMKVPEEWKASEIKPYTPGAIFLNIFVMPFVSLFSLLSV